MTEEQAIVDLKINNQDAINRMNELETKAKQLRKDFADAYGKGNQAEVKKINKELQAVNKEMERQRTNAGNIRAAMQQLDRATPKELQKTIRAINAELNYGRVVRGSKEWDVYIAKLKEVKAELKKVQAEQKEMEGFWSRMKNKFNDWGAMIATGMAGMAGVIMSGKAAVKAYAEMEQEEASVRKYTGMTAEEVEHLNEEFKKIDTRTSREQLNKLAQDAGRLGKSSQEDVLGFVRAADKINVALEDLGDGATLTLSKLTGIFGQEQIYGTEKSLLKVGSVINELSQNCTASAPYIAEFTSRMGGVAAQAGLTVQQVMAFGAVLDANNQKVEASATALSQVLVRLYRDPAKYAKVAGLDVKEFSELVKKDMNEALITLLTALNKAGGMDKLSPMFKEMGENGARAITALSTLAGKIEDVRSQQEEANKAFEEGTSIDKEFAVQNGTVQTSLEKARKGFNELAITLGKELLPVMRYCITGTSMLMRTMLAIILFIKGNYKTIVTLTATIVAYYTATKAANGYTLFLHKSLLILETGLKKATIAFKTLTTAMRTNPVGVITAAFTALVGVLWILQDRSKKSADAMETLKRNIQNTFEEIERTEKSGMGSEISILEILYDTTQDVNRAMEDRLKAIAQLREKYPDYFKNLSDEEILAGKAADAYARLRDNIISSAKARVNEKKIEALTEQITQKEEELKLGRMLANAGLDVALERNSTGLRMGDDMAAMNVEAARRNIDEVEKQNEELEFLKKEREKLAQEIVDIKIESGEGFGGGGGNAGSDETDRLKKEADERAAIRDRELAENLAAYSIGLKDYRQFTEDKQRIEKEYFDWRKSSLENQGLTDTAEYASMLLQEQEMLARHMETSRKFTEDELKREHELRIDKLTEMFYDTKSVMYQNENSLNQALLDEDIRYLREKQKLYEEGSKEYADIAIQIEDRLRRDQLDKQKELIKKFEEWRKGYQTKTVEEQMKEEIDLIKLLYDKKIITEEQFQEAIAAIKKKYAEKEKGELQKSGDQWADLTTRIWESFKNLFDGLKGGFENIGEAVSATADLISASLGMYMSYASAERDLELAKIEKKYDKEIELAGNNSKKVAKIEAQKEKEIAKIKNNYNKKAMSMEIAQAIAQTAAAAINAYASAAKTAWWLGPIAAAMATSAGMIQVATIKKQHEAEAAGYYSGGYTAKDPNNRKEVGVVHANEFVANHQAVANPQLTPVLKLIDYAQRNNTVARLTREDVSNVLAQGPGVSARGGMISIPAPKVIVTQQNDARVEEALKNNAETMRRLNDTLADGIDATVEIAGENGLDNKYKKFNRLKNNPSR